MASSTPDPATGKRPRLSRGRAVIAAIGIDRYEAWPALSNAVNDARSVLARFQELGFEELPGTSLIDGAASGDAIRKLVVDDLRVALTAEDSLVLFFAGHGYTTRREIAGGETIKTGYLIGANGELPEGNVGQWVELDAWLRGVAQLPARHILAVLDACHSGIALRLIKYRDVEVPSGGSLDPLRQRRSRRVITSALDDQRALDSGPRPGHSLFTACLLEALANGTGRGRSVTGSEIGLYLQKQVGDRSAAKQTPDFGVLEYDDRGELVLELFPSGTVEVVVDAGRHVPPPGWRRRRVWLAAGLAVGMALVAAVLVLPRLLGAPSSAVGDGGSPDGAAVGDRETKVNVVGGAATIVQPPGVAFGPLTFEPDAATERMFVQAAGGPQVAVRDVKQLGPLSLAIRPDAPGGFSIRFADQGTLTCERGATHVARLSVPRASGVRMTIDGMTSTWEWGRGDAEDLRVCLRGPFASISSATFQLGEDESVVCANASHIDRVVSVPVAPPLDRLELGVGDLVSSWRAASRRDLARACVPANGDLELAVLPRGQHVTLPPGLGATRVGIRRPGSTDAASVVWAPCRGGETARAIELVGTGAAAAAVFGVAPIASALAVTCSPPRTLFDRGRACSLGDSELRCESIYTGPCRVQTDGEIIAGSESASCAAATPAEAKRARDRGLQHAPELHCTEVYRCR